MLKYILSCEVIHVGFKTTLRGLIFWVNVAFTMDKRVDYLILAEFVGKYYPTPLPQVGSDAMSVFKWSKSGLNSEFSFS